MPDMMPFPGAPPSRVVSVNEPGNRAAVDVVAPGDFPQRFLAAFAPPDCLLLLVREPNFLGGCGRVALQEGVPFLIATVERAAIMLAGNGFLTPCGSRHAGCSTQAT